MQYLKHKKQTYLKHLIALPILYSAFIPLIIADLWVELYHHICFRLYDLKLVKRSSYIRIDRHKLKYLTPLQKIGCMYCGYANGLVNYWVEIAARTEGYFCGIMHESSKNFIPPKHHKNFARYGDEKDFRKRYI